jgi:hypothetical protein
LKKKNKPAPPGGNQIPPLPVLRGTPIATGKQQHINNGACIPRTKAVRAPDAALLLCVLLLSVVFSCVFFVAQNYK